MKEDGEEEQETNEGTEEVVQVELCLTLLMEPVKIKANILTTFHGLHDKIHFFLVMAASGDGGFTPGCELSK